LLLNFARFIEWPASALTSPRAPIDICVFAPNPFSDALDCTLQSETVGEHPLVAREVRRAAESVGCHLLFISAAAETRGEAAFWEAGPHTITVVESPQFQQMGAAVTFVLERGRVRFNVNLRAVEERGIRISARMLHLASRVDRATPEK
jgi:hypothetical protein